MTLTALAADLTSLGLSDDESAELAQTVRREVHRVTDQNVRSRCAVNLAQN